MTQAPTKSATNIAKSARPRRLFLRESSGVSTAQITSGSIAAATNSNAR